MKAWREPEPATPDSEIAPLSLRRILGAPPVDDNWWSQHRNLLWSLTGWLTSAAVVVSAGYLLWAMMYRHASDADPFLGLPRPRATSTTAPPPDDRRTEVAEVLKVVRPEPLSVATTAGNVGARSTTVTVNGGAEGGRSGPNPGPAGPASATTVPSASGGATTVDDGGGRNRGQGGGSPESSSSTTARTTGSTTRPTSSPSTSTSSTVDDQGGGSGSGSGGGSGSGSGGSGKG